MRKKLTKKGSITSLIITMVSVMIITAILSLIGLEGQQTTIASSGTLETYLITTNNIFSSDGIRYIFSEAINNFLMFKPLIYFIIALIGVSIIEKSGLLNILALKLKRLKFRYLTILVMIISLLCLFFGDYAFVYLLPFIAILYKKIGKNPLLGIITVFLTLTLGYGLGMFADYSDYYLGTMTQLSARLDVDKNYIFNLSSNMYITAFASIIFIIITSYLIENKLALKFSNPEIEEEEVIIDKRAGQYTFITFLLLLVVVALLIMPNVPYLGILLDHNETNYMAMLLGPNSPFGNGLLYIITIIMMICSYVYGKVSGNIKNSTEYTQGLATQFDKTGYVFVLMFFMSQLIGIIEWTNVGNVITANLLNFMSGMEFSGIPLIFVSFILIILMAIFIPSSADKWVLISPIIIPLFMRSNITPDFTQFVFSTADGIGKALTPIFPYYIVMLGLIEKYKDKEEITFYGIIKMLLPTILIVGGILVLLLISWFLIGLPLGIGTLPSL